MSKSNATENDMLALIFRGTAVPWAAAAQLDVHLHVADPGEAGTSASSSATYTGYAPITVNRNSGAWGLAGQQISNTALLQWPICTAGANTITHLSVTPSGSTQILYSGAFGSPLSVSSGIQPQVAAASLTVSED